MDQEADVRLVANLHLSRRRMARGQRPDRRGAHARLLAGFERVRRRARLRGGDARSRQALRPPQSLGHSPVSQAHDERRGDGRTGARGGEEVQPRRRTLYPPDVLGRAWLAHVLCPAGSGFDPLLPLHLRSAVASADGRRRSPAPLSPSRSASPCRSKPRRAASIPTTGGRSSRLARAASTIASCATCWAMSRSWRLQTYSWPGTAS